MVRARAAGRLAGRIVLDVLAAGGVVCIVLVVLALTMRISLVLFATGSMGPGIPAGSVALVREVPATEIEVGDVVTVAREGELPITHRVTEIVDVDGATVTFTMQGDANATPDAEPYVATEVRLVLGSVPGLAHVVVWFQRPLVLGGITIAAALLVTWAFWPRQPRPAPAGEGHADDGEGVEADDAYEPQHAR